MDFIPKKWPNFNLGLWLCLLTLVQRCVGDRGDKYGYLSRSDGSYILLNRTLWSVQETGHLTQISFRTCSSGDLLYQEGLSGDWIKLSIKNGSVEFSWLIGSIQDGVLFGSGVNKNEWLTLNSHHYLGNLFINVTRGGRQLYSEIIFNSTYRTYFSGLDLHGGAGLYVGQGFTGCLMEGPNVVFRNNQNIAWNNVTWSNTSCPQSETACHIVAGDIDDCFNQSCNAGTCIDLVNTYECVCPHLYNGTHCENDLSKYGCIVEPCLNGGTCLNETHQGRPYSCQCPSGFVGINCDSDINECGPEPCQNGATCTDEVDGFRCDCNGTGFEGDVCDINIDECSTGNVCGDQGTCFDNIGSYTCGCPAGSFGPQCEDTDECQSDPCKNGATCLNEVNQYTCQCPLGYTGVNCETDFDNCANMTCIGENTECKDLLNNYTCVCKPGFTGVAPICEDVDECASSPCRNEATCENLENEYRCICPVGYTDKDCGTDIDDCQGHNCTHGATCVDQLNGYACTCVLGYTGQFCEEDINECAPQPCDNGATCLDDLNSYHCICQLGFTGTQCETDVNECLDNPCGENGLSCSQGTPPTFTCTCKPGYNGSRCEFDIDECASSPCQNGATCTDLVNTYNCTCPPQWMGHTCSEQYNACSPDFEHCKNNAACASVPPSLDYNCTCLPGYRGTQCEVDIDECATVTCPSPFECYDQVNSHSCECKRGFTGSNCSEDIDECSSSPCQNGATCVDEINSYSCLCDQSTYTIPNTNRSFITGFQGDNCELDINECLLKPSVCLNGGSCENENGSFTCFCGRDDQGNFFPGANCETVTSYCIIHPEVQDTLPACKHGNCTGLSHDFLCTCDPGYTGRRCDVDIDECVSDPCQNNGTCTDQVNGYYCTCIPGITGTHCETNINECESNPCLIGSCIDHINSFECNCTDTGFKGDLCEINIDDCESSPCVNNATCGDLIKDYNCACYAGYTSKNCEVDINECSPNPCDFESKCLEKSNMTLYDTDYKGFENLTFSYANAAGYICECVPGSTGPNCSTNINDCQHDNCNNGTCVDLLNGYKCNCDKGFKGDYCDVEIDECLEYSPCKNGAGCTDMVADYECLCPPLYNGVAYAGKNCTFELTACMSNLCQLGSTCQPYLIDEATAQQDYRCFCAVGYTGRFCNISTTMSFTGENSMVSFTANPLGSMIDISLRFRTTLTDAVLLSWSGADPSGLYLYVQLSSGNLELYYHSDSPTTSGLSKIDFPGNAFNDAEWNQVNITINRDTSVLSLRAAGQTCTASNCMADVNINGGIVPLQNFSYGNLVPGQASGHQYVGCMEDISVDGVRLAIDQVPSNGLKPSLVNVEAGCQRDPQCFANRCNKKGTCVDLWNKFRCDCRRPYLGTTCETGYTAATFAKENTGTSVAQFDLTGKIADLPYKIDMSFFIRTRQDNGLIFVMGDLQTAYVSAELTAGYVLVRTRLCSLDSQLVSNHTVADGNQHLLHIIRNHTHVRLEVDGTHQSTVNEDQYTCPFNPSRLVLGGEIPQPNVVGRKRRSSHIVANDHATLENYKGTLQDVRLNGYSLQLYPLTDPSLSSLTVIDMASSSNLVQGESSDDTCQMQMPCENNATCSNVFFNDFSCACLPGYRGKNCSELDFCVTGTCPDGSTCQSLLGGFECISAATFDGSQQYVTYSHNLETTDFVHSFSFVFRTYAMNGWILRIGDDSFYYKARLIGSNVVIEYKLDSGSVQSLHAEYDVSSSEWLKAKVTEDGNLLVLTISDPEEKNVLFNVSTARPTNDHSLTTFLSNRGNRVNVGNMAARDPRNPYYSGCLREVRIEGILLPFFHDVLFVNNTSVKRFLLEDERNIVHGCQTRDSCTANQCRNGADCVQDYYTYGCNCSVGYEGRWCEDMVDNCVSGSCSRGQCVTYPNTFTCDCPAGFTGARCETDVNECSDPGVCSNGGTCSNRDGNFTCMCPNQYTGDTCDILLSDNCSSNPCGDHGSCTILGAGQGYECLCDDGYTGDRCTETIDYCADVPCKNGATCVSVLAARSFSCQCPTGYSGGDCGTEVDDCTSSSCKNGGVCEDGFNTFACNCTRHWTGSDCTVDIDECSRDQPCQNGGLCNNNNGGFTCDCSGTGFDGKHCQTDIDECKVSTTCKNGATCNNTIGDYECNCTDGYYGKDCGTPNCTDINCQDGVCKIYNMNWQCDCQPFYEGQYCGIKGPCASYPCAAGQYLECRQNISKNISESTYECICETGWNGTNCTSDINECEVANFCSNGGTCKNLPGLYSCSCPPQFNGSRCELDVDECLVNPCQNEGHCDNQYGGYSCNCSGTGYESATCEVDVDECVSSPCFNGGTCSNTNGSYICACIEDWTGQDCEIKSDAVMQDDNLLWYIVGPAVAVVLILIVIGVVWFLLCVRNKRATRGAYSPSRQETTGARVELGNVLKKPPLERLI